MIDKELIEEIAKNLEIEPALTYAVSVVESSGSFSYKNGKIPILFERHIFYRLLKKEKGLDFAIDIYKKYPNICNPKAGGYGLLKEQYKRLAKAIKINNELAHQSTSFGAFQIMGFHYKACGYKTAVEMSNRYHANPNKEQIKGFINFIRNNKKIWRALKEKNFKKFARLYNGKGYKKNRYDKKIEVAYLSYLNADDGDLSTTKGV
jgi:hypothetical protein